MGYYMLRSMSWLIYKIPDRITYLISDLLFVILFYLARYRRDVVTCNLSKSFPEKSKKELDDIAVKFYHHLCDCFLETLYFDWISDKKVRERVKFINPEMANEYMEKGRTVIVLMGHYNNWECFNNWGLHSEHKSYAIYKKLRNRSFERFYIHLRSRFGSFPLERALTFRQLSEDLRDSIPSLSLFLIDQTPRVHDIQYWTTFLNQDTAVLVGPEKIAVKLNTVVLFGKTKKVKRGFYEVEFELITENAKSCRKFEITEKSTNFMERLIIESPEFWLWSHRKWKHKRATWESENLQQVSPEIV